MKGKRLLIHGNRQTSIEEFDVPEKLGHGEHLVEVHHSLISPGTELSSFRSARRPEARPFGYTATGRVIGVGPGVDQHVVGRRVYVYPGDDEQTHCHATHKRTQPDALLVPLPDALGTDRACFARMINIALTPFCYVGSKPYQTVLVMGLGLVGQIVSQVARIRGCYTIGMEPDAKRRARAEQGGIDATIDPGADDPVTAVRNLTAGRGADLTINATGVAATFPTAIAATATGGELSTLGGARGDAIASLGEIFMTIHTRHITVRGGWEMLVPRRRVPGSMIASTEDHLHLAMRWLLNGQINLDPIWTHTIGPHQMQDAYLALDRRDPDYLGVIVHWREG